MLSCFFNLWWSEPVRVRALWDSEAPADTQRSVICGGTFLLKPQGPLSVCSTSGPFTFLALSPSEIRVNVVDFEPGRGYKGKDCKDFNFLISPFLVLSFEFKYSGICGWRHNTGENNLIPTSVRPFRRPWLVCLRTQNAGILPPRLFGNSSHKIISMNNVGNHLFYMHGLL